VIFPSKPGLHGVRLDAFIEEEGTDVAPGSIYDLEPEKKAGEKSNLPKRIRFYHSKIDINNLHASEKHKKLPQVWVIFITSFDPFDQNRLVYTIKNHCVEVPDMDYDDGATTLLLYVDGDPEGYPKELVQLLAYMKNSIPENVCNPDLAQIHSCVDKVKKDPKVREVFVTLEEYVEREKAEALEEAERKITEEKMRADKADRQIITSIRMIMSSREKSADSAMDELGIDVEMRDYYKAML
jgi:predicted transposase/invertase (TIGR01784 family)